MKSAIVGLVTLAAISWFASPVLAQPYSIREVGFVEVETKPFRLVLIAKDLALPAVQKQRAVLENEIADSNIVLVAQQADAKTVAPDKTPIGALNTPQLWLIAPDDRVIPFHAAGPMADLIQSPLRKQILHEVSHALCAVILLESTDLAANEVARAKVKEALADVKKVRLQLDHAPQGDLEILALSVADRPRERWTLWGLGEDVAESKTPKVAVLFGKMRRAGPLFEGLDWPNDDLFARIVALAQACEDELDRKDYFGPPLPFQWTKDWLGHLGLPFDPQSDKVMKEMAGILRTPELALDQRTQRRLTPNAFNVVEEDVWLQVVPPPSTTPSYFAGQQIAIILVAGGALGWVLLGTAVMLLDRRRKPIV